MLGTTFPDESTLPPNDGAGLLTEVTPFLKRGDVVLMAADVARLEWQDRELIRAVAAKIYGPRGQ